MSRDIAEALDGWDFRPGVVQARLVSADDGKQVIQMRVELGILQLETSGRPDGQRPHGHPTYLDYLKQALVDAEGSGQAVPMTEAQGAEADREFVQFYHRRVCWLALRDFAGAVADADHTLAFMDFVRAHSPCQVYTDAHERYRGFVHFHRAQAASALRAEANDPVGAIDEIREGLKHLGDFFRNQKAEDQMEKDGMVQQLRKMENALRQLHRPEGKSPQP